MPLTKMPECNDYTGRPGPGGNCSQLSHPEKCNKGMGPTATPKGPLGPHGLTGLPILNPLIPWRSWQSQKMCHQLPKLTLNLRGGDSRTQYQDTICRCSPRAGMCTVRGLVSRCPQELPEPLGRSWTHLSPCRSEHNHSLQS